MDRPRLRRDTARRARPAPASLLACTRCRRSPGRAGRSRSTAHGARSPPRPRRRATRALWLAETLGLHPFELADDARPLYHAGAAIASNFLVTLQRAAARLFERRRRAARGARPADAANDRERLRADGTDRARRLDDGRQAPRGDSRRRSPSSSRSTRRSRRRRGREDRADDRGAPRHAAGRPRRPRTDDGGPPRRPRRPLRRGARHVRHRRRERVRQPGAVLRRARPRGVPARRGRRLGVRRGTRRRRPLRACCGRAVPARIRDVGRAGGRGRRARRSVPPRALPRRRDGVPEAVQPRPARRRVLRPQGRPAGRGGEAARPRPRPRARDPRRRRRARPGRSRAVVAERAPLDRRAPPRARDPAGARDARPGARPRDPRRGGIALDYVAVADLDGPTLAVAARVGSTRLIDNVRLEGGGTS